VDPYQIVLADPYFIFRMGMKQFLETLPENEITGCVDNSSDFFPLIRRSPPDMVIIDIALPYIGGIEIVRDLTRSFPKIDTLITAYHYKKKHQTAAISAGARGYILKENSDSELLYAIKSIRKGEIYLSQGVGGANKSNVHPFREVRKRVQFSGNCLTRREKEILMLIATGKYNKEIAEMLSISVRTVENHRASILKKINVRKTVELVRYAMQMEVAGVLV